VAVILTPSRPMQSVDRLNANALADLGSIGLSSNAFTSRVSPSGLPIAPDQERNQGAQIQCSNQLKQVANNRSPESDLTRFNGFSL
jgi:hypothetical protein